MKDNNIISKEELEKSGFVYTKNFVWVYELDKVLLIYDPEDKDFRISYFCNRFDDVVSLSINVKTIEDSLRAFHTFKGFHNQFV